MLAQVNIHITYTKTLTTYERYHTLEDYQRRS